MDSTCKLIKKATTGRDQYGNPQVTETEREVFCRVYGITRSEFYQAAVADLHPEITIRLSDFLDYEGEDMVEHDGIRYSVIRTYRDSGSFHHRDGMEPNGIELILGRKVGDG